MIILAEEKIIKVKVFRFNPLKDKEPSYKTYEVPLVEGMSVLNVLNYIYENIDGSLSYYYSCRRGSAACCAMMVNGEAVMACATLANGDMTIEPPKVLGFEVIKDLIASDILLNTRDLTFMARAKTLGKFKKVVETGLQS